MAQQGRSGETSAEALQQAIDDSFWKPEYRDCEIGLPFNNTYPAVNAAGYLFFSFGESVDTPEFLSCLFVGY